MRRLERIASPTEDGMYSINYIKPDAINRIQIEGWVSGRGRTATEDRGDFVTFYIDDGGTITCQRNDAGVEHLIHVLTGV